MAQPGPDRNDEYLFYQTLVGTWPADSLNREELAEFRERIAAYMQKAIKEAKVHTSWVNPNDAYVRAVESFVAQALSAESGDEFMNDFSQFHRRIAYVGMLNSLAQTLLKMTAPGVPDFYQGTELWDLSLVDPDNRRPVDYAKRIEFLERTQAAGANRSRRSFARFAFPLARRRRQAVSDLPDIELSTRARGAVSTGQLCAALCRGEIP